MTLRSDIFDAGVQQNVVPVGIMDCVSRTSSVASTSGRFLNAQSVFRVHRAPWKSHNALLPSVGGKARLIARPGTVARRDAQRPGRSIRVVAHSAASADRLLDEVPRREHRIAWRSEYDGLIVGLAVPALGSILLDPIMSLVDTGGSLLRFLANTSVSDLGWLIHNVCTAFVGRLGAAQLGAVGLSTILFNFCGMLFNFLVVVTTPLVAAAVAQNDFEKVSHLWTAAEIGALWNRGMFHTTG